MKTLRFLHTADWHADSDPKEQAKLEASLAQIVKCCSEIKVNAIIHAGDVWEKSQKYQQNSGVPLVQKYLRELSRLVDFIFITKGNNSHDEPGSIELLHQLEPNIYAFEYPVVLGVYELSTVVGEEIIDLLRNEPHSGQTLNYIISLVPYPTKASLLIEDSIDNNNAEFIQKFEGIFEAIGEVTQPYTCPKILAFHGNVIGSRLSSGQTLISQDILVAPCTLEKANHNYYALGHIHLRQEVANFMIYPGSIYNKNWGEIEQKSFEVVEFDNYQVTYFKIPLTSARPMQKIDAVFTGKSFKFDGVAIPNAETRFRITLNENERKLLTDEKLEFIRKEYGNDVKIEFNIIPVERESRSEQIMDCKDLLQEVIEYAKIIEYKVDNGVMAKVAALQEKGVESL